MSEQSARTTSSQETLARLWEDHIRHEFETRSTEDTLATMVEDAYVDHVPVLTGGRGKAELREFYATHFIPRMPPDMEMVPISRTIGSDQLVDEMVIKFTLRGTGSVVINSEVNNNGRGGISIDARENESGYVAGVTVKGNGWAENPGAGIRLNGEVDPDRETAGAVF